MFSTRLQIVLGVIKFLKNDFIDIMKRIEKILYELINVLEDLEAK